LFTYFNIVRFFHADLLSASEVIDFAGKWEEVSPCPIKPAYWTEVLTRKSMIERGFSAYKLDNMPFGTVVKDGYDRLWWKVAIGKGNESLRPLGSRANTVWCR